MPTTKARRATGALASSANLLLPDALATGKLTIVPNAIAREITVDPKTGLVNGCRFVDRHVQARLPRAGARVLMVGRIDPGKHAPAAEFGIAAVSQRAGEFERRIGPLSVRPVLCEELRAVRRAGGARGQGAARI